MIRLSLRKKICLILSAFTIVFSLLLMIAVGMGFTPFYFHYKKDTLVSMSQVIASLYEKGEANYVDDSTRSASKAVRLSSSSIRGLSSIRPGRTARLSSASLILIRKMSLLPKHRSERKTPKRRISRRPVMWNSCESCLMVKNCPSQICGASFLMAMKIMSVS